MHVKFLFNSLKNSRFFTSDNNFKMYLATTVTIGLPKWWWQQFRMQRHYTFNRLHGVTPQNTVTFILTALMTSDITTEQLISTTNATSIISCLNAGGSRFQ